ncbi:MAG: pyridoxal-dependent decarboxylase, partial [Candidatus Thermoplasmatota archaeon]
EELSEICQEEEVFLHVDAAFGGYVIPFLKRLGYNTPDFDFILKGVSSLSIDAHKMGCSVIPLGMVIVRDKEWIDQISVDSPYISVKRQAGILGTRSGGPVAAAYALARYLGVEGYTKIVEKCLSNTRYLEGLITDIGLNLVVKPTMNVLGVRLNRLSRITDMLSENGWRVNKIESLSCIRIVVMPHVTKRVIDEFIPVLRRICREVGEI